MASRNCALAFGLVLATTLGPAPAHAEEEPPIIAVEARVGYGMAFGGGAGSSVERWSPVTISALVDHAVVTEPWTSLFAGVAVEGHGRGAAGGIVGLRVRPAGRVRVAGGAIGLLVPATLFGPLASVGMCFPVASALHVCADLEGSLFVAGSDLPDDRIAAQAQLVAGIAFDAW
jgi:hypothetical protein